MSREDLPEDPVRPGSLSSHSEPRETTLHSGVVSTFSWGITRGQSSRPRVVSNTWTLPRSGEDPQDRRLGDGQGSSIKTRTRERFGSQVLHETESESVGGVRTCRPRTLPSIHSDILSYDTDIYLGPGECVGRGAGVLGGRLEVPWSFCPGPVPRTRPKVGEGDGRRTVLLVLRDETPRRGVRTDLSPTPTPPRPAPVDHRGSWKR